MRDAVCCYHTGRCKDMKNIGAVRITTLKQDALKASCSKNFTHHRNALRKPSEKLLGSATKTSHLSLKTPQFFCTAPLGFTRHCATGQRHPKVTPFSRAYTYAPVSQFLFFPFTSSPMLRKLLNHSEMRVKAWGGEPSPRRSPVAECDRTSSARVIAPAGGLTVH